jgi:hypothetical protein
MTRVMPLGLQIYLFKKRFLRCNIDRSDPVGDMDNIDWDILERGMNYHENLGDLKNNYPEYSWDDWREEQENFEKELEIGLLEAEERALKTGRISTEDEYSEEDIQPNHFEIVEENPNDWIIHTFEIEVKPHKTTAKGNEYLYGRIQLLVDPNLIGLPAKITIATPKL